MSRASIVVALVALAGCHPPGWGKGDPDPVDAAGGVDGPSSDGADPIDATPTDAATCVRSFRLEGNGSATTVLLTGDFVGWAGQTADGAIAMTLGGDQAWTATRTFAAGSYQYRFIVDGNWIPDPANPNTVPNGLGGVNSVVSCP